MLNTSTTRAPWYVIPSNHKWFRDLAISRILVETLDEMDLKLPQALGRSTSNPCPVPFGDD